MLHLHHSLKNGLFSAPVKLLNIEIKECRSSINLSLGISHLVANATKAKVQKYL